MTGVDTAIARFRELGLRAGTAAAGRTAFRELRGAVDRTRVRIRPPVATYADVERSLGGDPQEVFHGRVLDALPTVARWAQELEESPSPDLVARADAVAAHRFDLLGSGRVELGPTIDWTRDFKSGRRWPLDHISRVRLVYGDGSDVKVPWELSRGQHLPLLAAAARVTGSRSYLDELGAQLLSWIDANPVERGPNWASTMDVAIRAANWTAALALVPDLDQPWLPRVLESLLLHCRFIRSHLEWTPVRANHYLSDVVGLLIAAAPFAAGEGAAWIDWAVDELVEECEQQVREDGCVHEASISYHRLVTELLLCGVQAADALAPGRVPDRCRARLDAALGFVAAYTRPDGLAPAVGDSDDSRFLPLGDYGADPRSHRHLFRQAGVEPVAATGSRAYRAGGFYVLRSADLYALVRCGDTGVGGNGWHAHNDQLSFELADGATPLVVDPGTYLYTADPQAYARSRSTAFHATLSIDGAEQNELRLDRMFVLPDRTHSECFEWDPLGGVFAGRHHGFEVLPVPAVHTRRLRLGTTALVVEDVVESAAPHVLTWTFPLTPGAAEIEGDCVVATRGDVVLTIEAGGVEWAVEEEWVAPRYGVRAPAPFVRARKSSAAGSDSTRFELRVGTC